MSKKSKQTLSLREFTAQTTSRVVTQSPQSPQSQRSYAAAAESSCVKDQMISVRLSTIQAKDRELAVQKDLCASLLATIDQCNDKVQCLENKVAQMTQLLNETEDDLKTEILRRSQLDRENDLLTIENVYLRRRNITYAYVNECRMNGCTKCPICLDPIKDAAMALTCCSHLIHIKCDNTAIHGNHDCPMCRAPHCVRKAIKMQLTPTPIVDQHT